MSSNSQGHLQCIGFFKSLLCFSLIVFSLPFHSMLLYISLVAPAVKSPHSPVETQRRTWRWRPQARFEFASLRSVSCLPAAHFLPLHPRVAGSGHDTRPPRGPRGPRSQGHILSPEACVFFHQTAADPSWNGALLRHKFLRR